MLVFASLWKPHVLSSTQLLWYYMSHSSQHIALCDQDTLRSQSPQELIVDWPWGPGFIWISPLKRSTSKVIAVDLRWESGIVDVTIGICRSRLREHMPVIKLWLVWSVAATVIGAGSISGDLITLRAMNKFIASNSRDSIVVKDIVIVFFSTYSTGEICLKKWALVSLPQLDRRRER